MRSIGVRNDSGKREEEPAVCLLVTSEGTVRYMKAGREPEVEEALFTTNAASGYWLKGKTKN